MLPFADVNNQAETLITKAEHENKQYNKVSDQSDNSTLNTLGMVLITGCTSVDHIRLRNNSVYFSDFKLHI